MALLLNFNTALFLLEVSNTTTLIIGACISILSAEEIEGDATVTIGTQT